MKLSFSAMALTGILVLALGSSAHAQVVLNTVASGSDSVDWSVLGAAFTTVSSPFTITSSLGNVLTVSETGSSYMRLDQGNGWGGNFAPGAPLLWNQKMGPDTIKFSLPVSEVGFQIQQNTFGGFVAEIDAYNGATLLGSVTENGVSNGNADNTAIYIGVSSTASITSIIVTASNDFANDFAIGKMDMTPAASTPEPGSVALLVGMSVSGAGFLVRRRRNARKVA